MDLLAKLLSISYDMMMELYLKHKTPEEPTISSTFLLDKYKSREVCKAVVQDIIVEWFGNS
ncbi:MAG: hypothetical protein ACMG6E_03525 [Candidatus Roizmanbacteria bacterium]